LEHSAWRGLRNALKRARVDDSNWSDRDQRCTANTRWLDCNRLRLHNCTAIGRCLRSLPVSMIDDKRLTTKS